MAPQLCQRVPAASVLRLAQANVFTITTASSGWVIDRVAAVLGDWELEARRIDQARHPHRSIEDATTPQRILDSVRLIETILLVSSHHVTQEARVE